MPQCGAAYVDVARHAAISDSSERAAARPFTTPSLVKDSFANNATESDRTGPTRRADAEGGFGIAVPPG